MIVWGLGIGDWGLGIGDWGLGPIPNPQSPIPNPHCIRISFFKLHNQCDNVNIITKENKGIFKTGKRFYSLS